MSLGITCALLSSSLTVLLLLMSVSMHLLCLLLVVSQTLAVLLDCTTVICLLFFLVSSSSLFFVLLEISTLPMVLIILLFGSQPEKLEATYLMAAYSLLSGLPLLVMVSVNGGLETSWLPRETSSERSLLIALPLLAKLPIYLLHLWLPKAHVEAPTTGRVILASVMLKLGSLGLLHLSSSLPLLVSVVRAVGLVFSPLVASLQTDAKSVVAYRRVGHMALMTLSLSLMTQSSLYASWLVQVSHGYLSGVLFFVVGLLSHVTGSRLLFFGGYHDLTSLVTASLFNAGAPFSLSFFSEVFFMSTITQLGLRGVFIFRARVLFTTYMAVYLALALIGRLVASELIAVYLLLSCNLLLLEVFPLVSSLQRTLLS